MADVLVGSEGSDVKRLAALFNRILGAETISLSPPVQMLCDAMIGARPDFLFAVNAQGTILFASSTCLELAGVSAQTLEGEAFETLIDVQDRTDYRQFFCGYLAAVGGEAIFKAWTLRCAYRPCRRDHVRLDPMGRIACRFD